MNRPHKSGDRMPEVRVGLPAAEGIAMGRVRRLVWALPDIPHETVSGDAADAELQRFAEALDWAGDRLTVLKDEIAQRLGSVEARIFDPQMLMLVDPAVVDGTRRYIRENRLSAARAFDWRMLELKERWARTSHPMVLDRLNDLEDFRVRVMGRLLGRPDPLDLGEGDDPLVMVAEDFSPSFLARMDPSRVVALATDKGTRTSHWAILARSLKLPAAVGLGDLTRIAEDGQDIIVDGRTGRCVLDPDAAELAGYERRRALLRGWAEEVGEYADHDAVSLDGTLVSLRANLDLPEEARDAAAFGAKGIGLFRTEFLVVGRATMPGEDEQYEAYRGAAEAFPSHPVIIRTFDLGGDKFPMFLHMEAEENPFLGWRGVRVCLDQPELFLTQLRAILRATIHGDVRMMVPLVNTVEEVRSVRTLLHQAGEQLKERGESFNPGIKVGIMVETPAAALKATELAAHVDFFSIGTNDLVQYTLAVDRTNTRLAKLFDPFHPSVLRQISLVARAGRSAGIEVSVCGELAAKPLGVVLLLGLDILALSVAWQSVPEIKKLIGQIRIEDARRAANSAMEASSGAGVRAALLSALGESVDLDLFPSQ